MKRRPWVASLLLLTVGASSAEVLLGEERLAAEVELPSSTLQPVRLGDLPLVSGAPVNAPPADDCACLCPCTCANAQLVVVGTVVEGAALRDPGVPPDVPVVGLLTRPRARPPLRPPLA